ncbi:MAG TPA: hypothetical protein VHH88_04210, partial [Verrucomicrobiae bacterium]|nr:hypothetical protein [Verrucomicrobiae bacterium]
VFFSAFRFAERRLQIETLFAFLKPFSLVRAFVHAAFKSRPPWGSVVPECLHVAWTRRMAGRVRLSYYLNKYLTYLPDRLNETKWKRRCTIEGGDFLARAWQGGRPVVVAFFHIGPIHLLRPWFRGAGIPCATFVGERSENRLDRVRWTDPLVSHPGVPTRFHHDELKAAVKFLTAGNVLFIAVDGRWGKKIEIPFCPGWRIELATGAIRLAARYDAELVPCIIVEEGPWRFRIGAGRPVPREFLASEAEWPRAANHLLQEALPYLFAHPEQILGPLWARFRKTTS